VPVHDSFFVIRCASAEGNTMVTILHEVPENAEELGSFDDPGAAIDFAQQEVRRLNADGVTVEYVDPPEDLVGAG